MQLNNNTPPTPKQSRYTAHPLDDGKAIIRDREKHLATVPDMQTAMSLCDKLNRGETLELEAMSYRKTIAQALNEGNGVYRP